MPVKKDLPLKNQSVNESVSKISADADSLTTGELISLREAAALIGLSHESLQKYAVQGRLQARKMGRDWFTTPDAARAYLESRRLDRVPNRKK